MFLVRESWLISLQAQAWHRWRYLALAAAAIPCLALVYLRNPEEPGFYPLCPFYALTGLYCPGCGSLRGLHQLLHGNLIAAFGYNPYAFIALPFIAYSILGSMLVATSGRRLPSPFIHPAALWGLLGAILTFWVLRNLPVYPFALLAP